MISSKLVFSIFLTSGVLAFATEVKKGMPIGTVTQTESQERLREFPLTTLKEHAAGLTPQELSSKETEFTIDPRAVSWGFKLTFLGDIRPLTAPRKKLLGMVENTVGRKEFFSLYSKEVLVSDGSEKFWLPLQDPFLEDFKKEVKKGDVFTAQTRYFGSYFEGKPMPFFLMVDFIQIPKSK